MKCEHCGTELKPGMTNWLPTGVVHKIGLCRGTLKANLADAIRERDAYYDELTSLRRLRAAVEKLAALDDDTRATTAQLLLMEMKETPDEQ
jgi:hypothetical protein